MISCNFAITNNVSRYREQKGRKKQSREHTRKVREREREKVLFFEGRRMQANKTAPAPT